MEIKKYDLITKSIPAILIFSNIHPTIVNLLIMMIPYPTNIPSSVSYPAQEQQINMTSCCRYGPQVVLKIF